MILVLLLCSTFFTLCLGLVHNWTVFLVLSLLAGTINVVPQVIIPLAADVASPSRRHFCVSIVILIMGVLVARVFAGIIAQYTDWRTVYYFAGHAVSCVRGLLRHNPLLSGEERGRLKVLEAFVVDDKVRS